jgi:hypothetical protein
MAPLLVAFEVPPNPLAQALVQALRRHPSAVAAVSLTKKGNGESPPLLGVDEGPDMNRWERS